MGYRDSSSAAGHRSSKAAALALSLLAAAACSEAPSAPDAGTDRASAADVAASRSVLSSLPAVCGAPTVTTLIADKTLPVGSVEVTQNGTDLFVVYRTDSGWPIHKSALFVGETADGIPTNKAGNPQIGDFPYSSLHPAASEVIWATPIETPVSSEAVVAAFAEVGAEYEGAWGDGTAIGRGGNWSTYFTHAVAACVAETVGSEGATLITPDQGARLVIPSGALSAPVDISIERATVDDLLGPAESEAVEPAGLAVVDPLPSIEGVTPVANTIWDLDPDGTEFQVPATLTLSYDPDDLPAGADEAELGIFLVNGIFEPLPSTVDAEANTVTAQIEHFTYAFIGLGSVPLVDLAVTELASSGAGEAVVGQPLSFSATVQNLGPDDSSGGTLSYEATGDVTLGDVSAGCTDTSASSLADVAVECPVPSLLAGATTEIAPFEFTALSAGDVLVRASVSVAAGEADVDDSNDQKELTQAVAPDGPGGEAVAVWLSDAGANQVHRIDPSTNAVTSSSPVANPRGLRVTPDGSEVWVARVGGFISVLSTATGDVVATIDVGGDPASIAFAPDGSRAYVVDDAVGAPRILVIEAATRSLLTVVTTGVSENPEDIEVLPDGSKAYITAAGEAAPGTPGSGVMVLDLSSNTVSLIVADAVDYGLAVTADGSSVYVAQDGGGGSAGTEPTPDRLLRIDTASDTFVEEIDIDQPFENPTTVAVNSSGTEAFVAFDFGTLVIVDIGAAAIDETISLADNPLVSDLAITADDASLFAALFFPGAVAKIDVATRAVIATTPTGGLAEAIAIQHGP